MKKEKTNHSKAIHISILILVIFIICAVAAIIMLKYQVEGEKNPPFSITDFMLVSSAEGESINGESKWNFSLNQYNDIYIVIKKNENYKKKEIIKTISIENMQIIQRPKLGKITFYRPAAEGLYKMEEEYTIKEKIEYKGGKESNIKDLQIANQGGVLLFRVANQGIMDYSSEEDEVIHDGTLLTKAGIGIEEINAEISLDMIIETGSGVKYKATIVQKIPVGNLLEEGKGSIEKTDLTDVIFKRI